MLFENIPRKLSCFSSTISWMRVKSRQTTEYTKFSVDNLIYSLKPYNTYQLLVSISFHVLFFTNWKLILRVYVSVASVSSGCWKAITFRTCHGCNTALKAGNVVSRLGFFQFFRISKIFCRHISLIPGLFPDLSDFVSFEKSEFSRSSSSA